MSQTSSNSPRQAGAAQSPSIFASYRPTSGAYDEMFAPDGSVRPHWAAVAAAIDRVGQPELVRRWDLARRLLRDVGIARDRAIRTNGTLPRDLDPIPLLLAPEESRLLAEALEQRARLLSQLLADLYGPQKLLRDGLLPPDLIFGNPAFLHPCHGQTAPDDGFLHIYAADLARAPDGAWEVILDRTDAPSGAGYALENRIVVSRMLPNVFHECHVERLAPFFIALRETLARQAPWQGDNSRVVLLSKGPTSKHYFEDAFLSRYLGYTLVEGGDLTVRDERVLLKTLGGLLPVDVVLRRLADGECDPLELSRGSPHGVAGLNQAVRAGNVLAANPLGSALAQVPALRPFLPSLCRALLGEDLRLRSIESYWCGDPQSRRLVLDQLDSLIIRPAFSRHDGLVGSNASQAELAALRDRILAQPAAFVAQRPCSPSRAPVWTPQGLDSAFVGLRCYLVAANGGYEILPGGLSRVTDMTSPIDFSATVPARRKDVWMLSAGEVAPISLLPHTGQVIELRRSGAELPSRVADNMFWLGRHIERAEGAARLLRTTLARLTGESDLQALPELPALLSALDAQGQIDAPEDVTSAEPLPEELRQTIEQALPQTVFETTRHASLRATVGEVHRLASMVRDRISIDAWRIINRLDRELETARSTNKHVELADLIVVIDALLTDLAAFAGLMNESMTRGLGWRFLDLGRRIERALNMALLLEQIALAENPPGGPVLDALLEVADSGMTYHSRYLANLSLAPALDLLLTDEQNPRSMAFQLLALSEHVEQLPREGPLAYRDLEQRLAMSALHTLRMFDVSCIEGDDPQPGREALADLLEQISRDLPALSDAVVHRYLVHASPTRHLADLRPEMPDEAQD